jgi:hypothetical protein
MKGFMIFLAISLLVIVAIGYYELKEQDPDTITVRQNGKWVTLKRHTQPQEQTATDHR